MDQTIHPQSKLKGSPLIPGDKSLSHRGLLFGALAEGKTEVHGLSDGEDVRSTQHCLQALGVPVERSGASAVIEGRGLYGWRAPAGVLDCGNSGTTIRLLMGCLAGQNFVTSLTGDASLRKRPMGRVAEPLQRMGAVLEMTEGRFAPLTVRGKRPLRAIEYRLPVASAQVKSAVLLAALFAEGTTRLTGRIDSRDHTERLLPHFGVRLDRATDVIALSGGQRLRAAVLQVPGDPSSAAFWLAAAQVVPGGEIQMNKILLNPSRTGFARVLQRMGAEIEEIVTATDPEPVGQWRARRGHLKGVRVEAAEIPSLIDELPLLAVLAAYAEGTTEVRGAEELRIKETDRIEAIAENLRRMGAKVETFEDGFRVEGPQPLRGAILDSFYDHRIAMAFAIAALGAKGQTTIQNAECVGISYPGFFSTLMELSRA
jgi:3-phosphoshikimate 1-carboxyvinyltransferase